jgi:transposase
VAKKYTLEMKQALVAKTCSPRGPSISQLSRETGIPPSTIRSWVNSFSEDSRIVRVKRPQDWSQLERLEAVLQSRGLDGNKLGEFLRKNGLQSNHIEEWHQEIYLMANDAKNKRGRPRLDPEIIALREENKRLKRDLRRKDKALAEASAIMILKKKMEELWGSEEEDE